MFNEYAEWLKPLANPRTSPPTTCMHRNSRVSMYFAFSLFFYSKEEEKIRKPFAQHIIQYSKDPSLYLFSVIDINDLIPWIVNFGKVLLNSLIHIALDQGFSTFCCLEPLCTQLSEGVADSVEAYFFRYLYQCFTSFDHNS